MSYVIKRKQLSKQERLRVYEKCNGHCAYCGCELSLKDMQVDHIIPLALINDDKSETFLNYLPACRSCNHYKSDLSLEAFRRMVERMPDVLMRDSVTYKNAVRFGLVTSTPHFILKN